MARQLDPVTGAPVDWSTDPRNPAFDPSVAAAYDKKTTATFGVPLPAVFGTVKVAGKLVWMRDQAAAGHFGWEYVGNEVSGLFDCVKPATRLVVLAGGSNSTTHVNLTGDGVSWYGSTAAFQNQRIYFRDGPNAGLLRLITGFDWQGSVTVSPPLPFAPVAGNFVTLGPPILARTADCIYAICEAPVASVLRYFKGSIAPQTSAAKFVAQDAPTVETVVAATAGTWPGMQAVAGSVGMTLSGTAQFRAANLLLEDGKAPDLDFEVSRTGTTDENPADVVTVMTTLAGIPSANVDVELGSDGVAASSYRRYCTAMGFLVSRALTSRSAWGSYLEALLDQTNAVAVPSGSGIRIVPLGDEAVTGNGVTYTPPAVVVALGVDDFKAARGEDPVTVQRRPDIEVWNAYAVTYQDRGADYTPVQVEYIDPADSTTNDVRRAEPVQGTWITTPAHAQALAAIKAQRSIGIRNTYSFQLLPRAGALLEPMDFVQLTEPKLGLVAQLCRIKSVSEDTDGLLSVEAYEWPAGVASPIILSTQAYEGYGASVSLTPTGSPAADNALPTLATITLSNVIADSVTNVLIAPGAVSNAKLTSGSISADKLTIQGSDNLWPNPTSEVEPPADATAATLGSTEFYGRTADNGTSALAYAGKWFRRLNGNVLANFGVSVPVSAGMALYFEAYAKRFSGTGVSGGVYTSFYGSNANGTMNWGDYKGALSSPGGVNATSAATYTKVWLAGPVAAGASWAYCYLSADAGTAMDFDQLVLRRMHGAELIVDGSIQSKLSTSDNVQTSDYASTGSGASEVATRGVKMRSTAGDSNTVPPLLIGPNGMKVGSFLIDEVKSASLSAIGRFDGSFAKVWYRGNCDPAVNGGGPVVCDGSGGTNRLTLYSFGSNFTNSNFIVPFSVKLQPQADTDNLDAIRYVEMQFWTGTAGTLIDTVYLPFPDRKYRNATATDASNAVWARLTWLLVVASGYYNATSPFHFNGVVRLILHNVYGESVTRDFDCGAITAGAAKGVAVTAQATSYNLGGVAPPAGGGSGGGGACLDPLTPILVTKDGRSAPLHALRAGDLVWTRPEDGGEFGYHAIERATLASNLRQRVTLTDGRSFVCATGHRVNVRGVWRRADSLQLGEEMDGQPSGFIRSVEYLGEGPVVQLVIPTARTYFDATGLWQHNVMKI